MVAWPWEVTGEVVVADEVAGGAVIGSEVEGGVTGGELGGGVGDGDPFSLSSCSSILFEATMCWMVKGGFARYGSQFS